MEELSEYKPRDESFLEYRGLSIVFFQIFTFMDECDDCASCKIAKDFRDCKYIKLKSPNEAIDNQIFVYIKNVSPIKKYRLKGFKFKFTLKDEEDEEQEALIISGEMLVEMSIIYNRNVSLSYRMIIDDIETDEDKKANFVRASAPLTTDHLISLIAFFMDAEHWGVEEITCSECGSENIKEITTGKEDDDVRQYYFCNDCGVESYKDFTYGNIAPELEGLEITELFLDSGGVWSDDSEKNIESLKADYAVKKHNQLNHTCFKEINQRYKDAVLRFRNSSGCSHNTGGKASAINKNDTTYVFLDIWESFRHDGNRVIEGEEERLVKHIMEEHKRELVGLMSLYPSEWPYRTDESYDDVCGENIAIDVDDLVLANQRICVVFGAYGVRGDEAATDWAEVLDSRKIFHVSWPEYMSILEMLLIKKHALEYADNILLESVLSGNAFKNPVDAIGENAQLQLNITKMMAKLDAVKYLKFVSHKIMHDRTNNRFEIEKARDALTEMMERVDNSLGNIRDTQSMKQGKLMNFILLGISIASLCQIIFAEPNIPFIRDLTGEKYLFNMNNNHDISILMILFAFILFVIGIGFVIGSVAYGVYNFVINFFGKEKKWKRSKSDTTKK